MWRAKQQPTGKSSRAAAATPEPHPRSYAPEGTCRLDAWSYKLLRHLENEGYGRIARVLFDVGFNADNIHLLCQDDLIKLRITGDGLKVLAHISSFVKMRDAALSDKASSAASSCGEGKHKDRRFSATAPTANECARHTHNYLEHYSIERDWPRRSSQLARSLALSSALPHSGSNVLYSIQLDEEVVNVERKRHQHLHGTSAHSCHTCKAHVSQTEFGAWQMLKTKTVTVGDGQTDQVTQWTNINPVDAMKLEYNYRKRNKKFVLKKHPVNFKTMMWGERKIRRIDDAVVMFPTLRKDEIVPIPHPQCNMRERDSELSLMFLELAEAEERRQRIVAQQEEDDEREVVYKKIDAITEQYLVQQRADLEEEEAAARLVLEGGVYFEAVVDISDTMKEGERMSHIAEKQRWRDGIVKEQLGLVEDLEQDARGHVEAEEAAVRRGFTLLMKKLNEQVVAILNDEVKAVPTSKLHVRCPKCRRKDCGFFCKPWRTVWSRTSKSFDSYRAETEAVWLSQAATDPSDLPCNASMASGSTTMTNTTKSAVGTTAAARQSAKEKEEELSMETISTLFGKTTEIEYQDHVKNIKAERRRRKEQRRIRLLQGNQDSDDEDDADRQAAVKLLAQSMTASVAATQGGSSQEVGNASSVRLNIQAALDQAAKIGPSTPSPSHQRNVSFSPASAQRRALQFGGSSAEKGETGLGKHASTTVDTTASSIGVGDVSRLSGVSTQPAVQRPGSGFSHTNTTTAASFIAADDITIDVTSLHAAKGAEKSKIPFPSASSGPTAAGLQQGKKPAWRPASASKLREIGAASAHDAAPQTRRPAKAFKHLTRNMHFLDEKGEPRTEVSGVVPGTIRPASAHGGSQAGNLRAQKRVWRPASTTVVDAAVMRSTKIQK